MYEENKVKFNWKGFIIRLIIILALLILIIYLIVDSNKSKGNYSRAFSSNITKLRDVGENMFSNDNLPTNIGDSIKISLGDLVKSNKIDKLEINGSTCDEDASYIKATKKTKGYELETHLVCNEEKSTINTYLGCFDDCNSESTTTTTTKKEKTTDKVKTTKKSTTIKKTTTTTTVKRYAVIFNVTGGTNVKTEFITEGFVATRPIDPVKEGYTFIGWFNADGSLYDFSLPVNKNIILIAKWKQN